MCQVPFSINHKVVDGGATRFHSSQNGVSALPDDANGVVGIHDGVRPFVSEETIARCFEAARKHGAALPVLPVTDTLRRVTDDGGYNVQRNNFRTVQTPQAFDIQLLKQAFRQPYSDAFTDDASVVEAMDIRLQWWMAIARISSLQLRSTCFLLI